MVGLIHKKHILNKRAMAKIGYTRKPDQDPALGRKDKIMQGRSTCCSELEQTHFLDAALYVRTWYHTVVCRVIPGTYVAGT